VIGAIGSVLVGFVRPEIRKVIVEPAGREGEKRFLNKIVLSFGFASQAREGPFMFVETETKAQDGPTVTEEGEEGNSR